MKDKVIIQFDLSLMSLKDVKELQDITVKQQQYEEAVILRDYQKHLMNIKQL